MSRVSLYHTLLRFVYSAEQSAMSHGFSAAVLRACIVACGIVRCHAMIVALVMPCNDTAWHGTVDCSQEDLQQKKAAIQRQLIRRFVCCGGHAVTNRIWSFLPLQVRSSMGCMGQWLQLRAPFSKPHATNRSTVGAPRRTDFRRG